MIQRVKISRGMTPWTGITSKNIRAEGGVTRRLAMEHDSTPYMLNVVHCNRILV